MPRISAEARAQIKQAVRHPVVWWKGAGLPEERLRPWESGIQFLAEALKGFMRGFTDIRSRLYLGMGEGKIPPSWKSVSDVVTITWDAINDPPIGVYMDRRRFKENIHRWIMRFNATFSPLFILIQCFDFGMTPMQRIVQWTVVGCFADLMSTANMVSESKLWAGITPHSEQRGALQLFKTLGWQTGEVFSGVSVVLMGFKDILGITDYQIMIYGAMIFAPITIFSRWLPSFAKQRVDFSVKVAAEGAVPAGGEEERLSFRESFAIVKHNKWFMMWLVVNFIRIILPRSDEMFLYRFLIPKLRIGGEEIGGEVLYITKNIIIGLPSFALLPFAIQAVNKFGGKMNFFKAHALINIFARATTFFLGYKSFPRLIYMFFMEMIKLTMDMWSPVPYGMINYEMLDYVEWKTGYRSEGITQSVDGMLNKLIKNNLSSVFGNAVTQWTGYMGWDVPAEEQPERFLKTIWPLLHIGFIVGEIVLFFALLWFKYPHDPKEVEKDLIERRAQAAAEIVTG